MIISGVHSIEEAIAGGKSIAKIFVREDKNIPEKLYRQIRTMQIPFYKLAPDVFKAKYKNDSSILAFVEEIEYYDFEDVVALPKSGLSRILIVDEIEDPNNIGAMVRSSVGFGFNGIVLTTRRTVTIGEGTIRASSGTLFSQKMTRIGNLAQAIESMQKMGYWIIGTAVGAKTSIQQVDMNRHIAVVMGNEEKGVRQKILEKCDYLVKIPMEQNLNSLNVSVAFGILAYEIYKAKKALNE